MNKQLYEVINPSDEITFYATSDKVAVAAVLVCGEGQWGATRIEDDGDTIDVGGMALFADEEQTEKYLQKFNKRYTWNAVGKRLKDVYSKFLSN